MKGFSGILLALIIFLVGISIQSQFKSSHLTNTYSRTLTTQTNTVHRLHENLVLSFTFGRTPSSITFHQKKSYNIILRILVLYLLRSGDIETNPGPSGKRSPKNPRVACSKGVIATSKAVNCDGCDKWTHVKCTKEISISFYEELVSTQREIAFLCNQCSFQDLPFYNINVNEDDPPNFANEDMLQEKKGYF